VFEIWSRYQGPWRRPRLSLNLAIFLISLTDNDRSINELLDLENYPKILKIILDESLKGSQPKSSITNVETKISRNLDIFGK